MAFAGLTLVATQAQAQLCEGAASFRSGPVRLGAGLNVNSDAQSYGGQLAIGAPTGPFISGTVSGVQLKDVSGTGVVAGGEAGFAADLNPQRTAQFCPVVGFQYQSGPDVDTGFGTASLTAHAFSFGGSVGGTALSSAGFDFVPFVGAVYVLQTTNASINGFSGSSNDHFGEVTVGAGFVVSKVLTIQPAANIPVGLNGGKASFALAFAFNFGK